MKPQIEFGPRRRRKHTLLPFWVDFAVSAFFLAAMLAFVAWSLWRAPEQAPVVFHP